MKTNNVKDLKQRALAGDLSALEELRKMGFLSSDKLKYSLFPVSYAQQRLWFIDKMDHSPAYNLTATLDLQGKLNVEALKRAFQEIVNRHETLRTCFIENDGVPYQKIFDTLDFNLQVTDLSEEKQKQSKIESFLKKQSNHCFDLSKAPLMLCTLLKLDETEHLLLFNMHHIVTDGWSVSILIHELTLLYNNFCKNLPSPLSPLTFQYKDYVKRNELLLKSGEVEKHKNYWLEKLSGESEILELPSDKNRPSYKTFNGQLHEIEINETLHRLITGLTQKYNVSLFMFLASVVNILLNKYTGRTNITLGFPISGREQKDLEGQIGLYVNTIVLRNEIDVSMSFDSFLKMVKQNCIEAYDHQIYPFDLLVEDLNLERDTSRNPLFEIMISLQELDGDTFDLEGLNTKVLKPEIIFSKMDFHFSFEESADRMKLGMIYNPDLYTPQLINRLGMHFLQLLHNIVNNPNERISKFEIITEEEKEQILNEFNNTKRRFPEDKTIATIFNEVALEFLDKPAVVFQGIPLSYTELNRKANEVAIILQNNGLKIEEPVAILSERSHELIISILAVLKAGGAYVPLDSKFLKDRITTIIQDADIRFLLTDNSRETDFLEIEKIIVNINSLTREADLIPVINNKPSSGLAYILYTSGSTGKPKGSLIEDKSVVRLVKCTNYTDFNDNDRIFSTSSISFDATTLDIWGALLNGGTLFLESTEDFLDPENLKKYFSNYKITKVVFSAGFFNRLVETDQQNQLELFKDVKEVFVGGEKMSSKISNLFITRYPEIKFLNVYGPTENTTLTTTFEINQQFLDDIPIGKPIANTTVYIFDGQNNLCPIGIPGELCTGGHGLSRGYVNRPDLDIKHFIQNPSVPGEKLYKTGDMAKWDEKGNIHFIGRTDDQLKIRGFRIETGEIEKVALKCDGVTRTKILVVQEDDQKQLALYFTGSNENEEALRNHLELSLPDYMIPRYVFYVRDFPLNHQGKIDTTALPKPGNQIEKPLHVSSITQTGKALEKIFCHVLNRKDVPANTSFFSLGGHSLKAIKVVSAIQKELSIKISLKEFFAAPTILSLEKIIQNRKREHLGSIEKVPAADYYETSNAQRRLWVLNRIEKEKTTYNIPLAITIYDDINIKALQLSFDDLINRHESLRTVFIEIDNSPFQEILSNQSIPINFIDFSNEIDPDSVALNFVIKEAHQPFTLSEFPLIRLTVIKTSNEKQILFLNIHHIICDGWSLDIIVNELMEGYSRHLGQKAIVPPRNLPIQYKDYASWQNKWITVQDSQEDRDYWINKLDGSITPIDLPVDFSRPPVKTYDGDSLWISFPPELKNKLDIFTKDKRCSLFMVLVAAFKVLVYKYTSQEDIIIGTPVAGRNHPDLEDQIGYYVNTLALRDKLDPKKTFAEFLEEVKETATDAYSHQMYPFDKLIDELQLHRDTSRSPLFDLMIVLQNITGILNTTFKMVEPVRIPMSTSKFDLTFNFNDSERNLDLLIEFNTRLFHKERIKRMASHLQVLLQEVIINPAQKISLINILGNDEKDDLLIKFNNTKASYPSEKTIIDLFEESVVKYPSRTALLYGEKSISYADLNTRAEKLAKAISRKHLKLEEGEPVGLVISPSEDMIILMIAILKAGCSYVPIDPDYPGERIKHILEESQIKLLIVETKEIEKLQPLIESNLTCQVLNLESLDGENGQEDNPLQRSCRPETTAYVIFTSGSTGKPKGCSISHRNLVRLFVNDKSHFDFKESDIWIMAHSYCFDFSVWEMYGALLFGGMLILPERDEVRDISAFVRLVNKHQVTVLNQTPGAFYKFIDTAISSQERSLALRYVIFGGDKLNPARLANWIKLYSPEKVQLINMYGITETTIHVTYHRLTEREILQNDGSSNIGIPLPETQVYILNEYLQLAPIGVYGEIYVSGTGLCKGYLNRPDLTMERFVTHPFDNTQRIYKSGDVGRWLTDGTIEYLNRNDNQVQIRGFRVETAEIDMQLRKHPSIIDALVISVDQEGTKELVAYIITKESIKINELKSYLSTVLPTYMVPSLFMQVDKIPLTINGKIDYAKLPQPIQNIESGAIFAKPEIELEETILRLWQQVLPAQNISIYDNFFDIGGNSLLLVKLHSKINELYPGSLELTDLFSKSNISEQAVAILQKLNVENDLIKHSEIKCEKHHDIAIIGIASKIASCESPIAFWEELCKGTDFISCIPTTRIQDIQTLADFHGINTDNLKFREYSYLTEVDKFDYGFFKLSPSEASLIDPGQRLFMETANHAMEDAGYGGMKLWGSKTGVFIGASDNLNEYSKFIEASENQDPNLLLAAQTPSILASRLSYHFNLKGPAMLIDTACSSSLVALHLACQSIRDGKIDTAIVGGTKLHLLPFDTGSRMEIDSEDSRARSFDDSANGTSGGEGVIAILIKPLEQAIKDRDNIYAVIKGSETNQDGNSNGITAPNADAQSEVIDKAWQDAGIDPLTISFIETHGTATKLGDPIEIDGITKAFNRYTNKKGFCAIGAVKANIGHLDTVAGLAGVLKAVLSLKHKQLTPLVHFEKPNRNINFEESAAYINKYLANWESKETPLRCGVSSFGLSGTNCHVILEEAPLIERPVSTKTSHLFVLSSRSKNGLEEYILNIKKYLQTNPSIHCEDFCYTLATGRGHYAYRVGILFKSGEELQQKLKWLNEKELATDLGNDIFYKYSKIISNTRNNLNENEITENEARELSQDINKIIAIASSEIDIDKKVAQAYVRGATIEWENFYSSTNAKKVSLPVYPFERKRCWVKIKKNDYDEIAINRYGKKFNNILLNQCILDTPACAVYRTILSDKFWLINEHKVMDIPTLVGVSYLQIAWEAGDNHFTQKKFLVKDFYLFQPLTVSEAKTNEVIVTVNKTDENLLDIRVNSKINESNWSDYAKFKVSSITDSQLDEKIETLDISEIQSRMTHFKEIDHGNNIETRDIIRVSKKWNCLNKIWWNETEQIAELTVPSEDESLAEQFSFYPPLLDAALSFALDEPTFLPLSFGLVELRKKSGLKLFSYINRIIKTPETRSLDITLTDELGQIVGSFKNVTFKKTTNTKSLFYELTWKPWSLKNSGFEISDHISVFDKQDKEQHDILQFDDVTIFRNFRDNYQEAFSNGFPAKLIYILPEASVINLEEQLSGNLYSIFRLAKHLSSRLTSKMDILFVGKYTLSVNGEEKELHPMQNAVAGLGQVIQQENPNINCRFLDADENTTISELINEVRESFKESYYYRAIRNGQTFIREIKSVNIKGSKTRKLQDGTYVITGGIGGIGLELADYIASQGKVKIFLLNRSTFPSRESWGHILKDDTDKGLCLKINKLLSIESKGGEVFLMSVDICEFKALELVFKDIRKHGTIRGIIHAAGIPGEGFIYKKDLEDFKKVIKPKIHGTINLCRLLEEEKLDFFLMTSALTAILPTAGQSDYTAGNSFLDAVCLDLRHHGVNAISINLTAWQETGMAFEYGISDDGFFKSIDPKVAVEAIGKILNSDNYSVILGEADLSHIDITAGLPFYLEDTLSLPVTKVNSIPESTSLVKLSGRETGIYSKYEKIVAKIWGEILGYTELSILDNYYDLGGDSIHAIKISSMLEKQQLHVSIGELFNYLTIADLAYFLESKIDEQPTNKITILPSEKCDHYPVSSSQRRLFILDQLTTDKLSYHIPEIWKISGYLKVEKLIMAFQQLVKRHEILRTSFRIVEDLPVQVVQENLEIYIPTIKLTEEEAQQYIHSFIQPFELNVAPLFRVVIIELASDDHLVLFDAHHIIIDAFSMEILKKEIFLFYEGTALEPLKIQYKDYAIWQTSTLQDDKIRKEKVWWIEQFQKNVPLINLPLDFPRIKGHSTEAGIISFAIDDLLTSKVKRMSSNEGLSTFMILLGVYQLVIHKYTQQNDIVIGVTTAGRVNEELSGLLGMFVNNLPIRAFPIDEMRIIDFLNEIKKTTSQAFANQDYPFDELVENLNIKRDLNRSPLFDIVFSYMNFTLSEIKNNELAISDYKAEPVLSSEYDIMLYGLEAHDKIYITVKYKKAIFKKESIQRFADHFIETVKFVTKNNYSDKICDLDIIQADERKKLDSFNCQYEEIKKNVTVFDLLKASFTKNNENTAILFNDQTVSYHNLEARSNQLAHYLRKNYSIKFGDRVGILLERDANMVVAMLAVIKSGAAYIGIDPAYPKQRIEYMLNDSRAKVLVTHNSFIQQDFLSGFLTIDIEDQEIQQCSISHPNIINTLDDPAYIIYTSGSTGNPKGVIITHKNLSVFLQWCALEYKSTPFEIIYASTSYCFDLSIFEIFYSLVSGKTIRILKSALEMPIWIKYDRNVLINTVPSLLETIKNHFDVDALNHVTAINLAGEQIPQSIIDEFDCNKVEIRNLYGPSEDTTYSTIYRFNNDNKKVLIGKPISNTQIYITDTSLKLIPLGHSGEICISGDGLAKGYLFKEELTNEKFIKNPFGQGRLYRTGDLGRWTSSGDLEYLGRIDRQIKIRGYRIELGEIETYIRQYPGIKNVVVIAYEDKGNKDIAAYLVATQGISISNLRDFLLTTLPTYMIPLYFVLVEQIPLTPNGKVDVLGLPDPNVSSSLLLEYEVETLDEQEEKLLTIWKQILNIDKISKNDNFFDIGGHSLKAFRLLSKINMTFNKEFSLTDIFENPSVSDFASLIKKHEFIKKSTLLPLPKTNYYSVSHAQRRLWTIDRIENNTTAYSIPIVYLIQSSLDLEALEASFNSLLRKFESFRTSFIEVDGEPKQVVQDEVNFKISVNKLSIKDDFIKESSDLINKTITKPFNLSRAPLLYVDLIINSLKPEYLLIINAHHIILDEWSIDIMVKYLALFYDHFSGRKILEDKSIFIPSPVQYKEFAFWQNEQINEGTEHQEFWKNVYRVLPPAMNLPTDFLRPKIKTFEGKTDRFILPTSLSESLKKLSSANNSTLFITSLALFHILFSKYTNQNDLVFGTPVTNRDHPQTHEQIGFFLNTLALRNISSQEESFKSFLLKVRQNTLEAFKHQQYPFDKLVDELPINRELSRSPLFDVMLISQTPVKEVNTEGTKLKLEPVTFDYTNSKFDLSISYYDDGSCINYYIEYNTSLFRSERISRLFDHFCSVIANIIEDENKPLSKISFVSNEERKLLIKQFEGKLQPLQNLSIISLIEKQANQNPKSTAVIYKNNKLTYKELDFKSNQLAHLLIERGICQGDFVGIMVRRSEWSVISLLAVLKSGAVYVPIDSSYPASRIEYILNDSKCKLIITSEIESIPASLEHIQSIDISNLELLLQRYNSAITNVKVLINDNAYVIYTSGSTGLPKGVLGTHGCLLNLIEWQSKIMEGQLKTLQFAPHSFDVSLQEILFALATAGTLYIIDNDTRYNMRQIADIIEREEINILTMPFSALNLYLDEVETYTKLKSIKHLITSGEQPFLNNKLQLLLKTFPDLQFHNQYGPSETHVVTSFTISSKDNSLPIKVPMGFPINNTQIYILDKNIEPLPVGIPGDLYIGGLNVANGYLNKIDLTSEKFINNPFGEGKLYRSGDLAQVNYNGELEFIGRDDGQVKVRGFRIELGEIESCFQNYPGIKEVALKLIGEEENKELAAYYTTTEEIDSSVCKDFLAGHLPSYMIPTCFVKLEEFPRTASGKIDKLSLPEPQKDMNNSLSLYVEPQGEVEITIAKVMEEILQINKISAHDDFFKIGGNSIKAIRLMSKVQKQLGKKINLNLIFKHSTIRHMATIIQETDERLKNLETDYILINPDCKKKLFFMPPGIGYSFAYLEYAKYFDEFGICGINFIESEEPARAIVEIIIKLQEEGPYYLFGHSAGGNMAYDVATELQKREKQLGGIVLLDSYMQLEIIEWSEKDYLNDAILYIEQNHAEFLDDEIKDAALQKIVAYRRYLNARFESGYINCPIIQIEANDEITSFGDKIIRNGWKNLTEHYEVFKGFGGHMDMLKQPFLKENAQLTCQIFKHLNQEVPV